MGAGSGGNFGKTKGAENGQLDSPTAGDNLSSRLKASDIGKTIVIGESMAKRIEPYAKQIGAEIYEGFKYYAKIKDMFGEKIANFIGGVDNALWLIDKMVNKYKIVDLGLDVDKATHSPFYLMESVLSYLYKNKEFVEEYMKGAF